MKIKCFQVPGVGCLFAEYEKDESWLAKCLRRTEPGQAGRGGRSYPLILQNKAEGTSQMSPKKDSSDTNFEMMTLDSKCSE